MKIINIILLLLVLSCSSREAIEPKDILKKHAITIQDLTVLNSKIYDEISSYDIIMLGEIHGTKEPSEFAYGLCDLLSKKEENIVLALEIPAAEMETFSDTMSKERLKELYFFEKQNSFGMNGEAWLNLIDKCNQNDKVTIKFMDNHRCLSRDSSMYLDICEIKKTYPHSKIVSLTGNVHNWLKPFKNKLKIGGYLMNDTINFKSEKIMSIDHRFNEGTMLNNMGDGLELKTIEGKSNIFNETISSEMFLCKRIDETQNQYTHFLYTEQVTHSKIIEKNSKYLQEIQE